MSPEAEREFCDFVTARSASLLRFAFVLTSGDQHTAEDLVQTVLAKAAVRWRRIDQPEPYLRRAIYHEYVSVWRRLSRWQLTDRVPEVAVADSSGQAADAAALRSALARLTVRQRTALVLRYLEDLPEREVAAVLGCSVGTVRSTTHRSLAKLRELAPDLVDAQAQEVWS